MQSAALLNNADRINYIRVMIALGLKIGMIAVV